jgi:polyisoprenoid-binding protein YceI
MMDAIEAGLLREGGRERLHVALIVSGAVITALAGAALAAAHRWAVPLMIALVLHQALYVAFAKWRAHVRGDPDLAAQKSTVNAAVMSVGVLSITLALWQVGKLG